MNLKFAIGAAIYAVMMWMILIWVWQRGYREWRTNVHNRLHKVHGRIVDKRETFHDHWLLFEYSGHQQEFLVDQAVYNSFRVGQSGVLHFHGDSFDRFELEQHGENADDIYRRMVR
jgi:hypothetical protein